MKNKVCLWGDYYGFAIYSATVYESRKSKLKLPLYVSTYLVYGGIVLIGFAILAISASLSIKIYDKADLA